MTSRFAMGVDLGQARDPSAIVIVEAIPTLQDGLSYPGDDLRVVHAARLPLRTSYPDIVRTLAEMLAHPVLVGACELVVDHTGVGRAPVDMLRDAGLSPIAVTITAGGSEQRYAPAGANSRGVDLHVPKAELVGALRVLLEQSRLRIASGCHDADTLTRELGTFRARVRASGHTAYEAMRDDDHDDLVIALALACWRRERAPVGPLPAPRPPARSPEAIALEAERLEARRIAQVRYDRLVARGEEEPWQERP